jgi:hypothetical protein
MLAVENKSDDHDLFLQSGDIVKGGRQDRLIASDLIVPPKSGKVACPANCCEQSRWSGRGQEAATHFAKSTDFAVGNDIKIANATRQQGEVWKNVEKAQKDLSEKVGKAVNAPESPTSLQLALEDRDLQARLAGYEKALAGVAGYSDAVGVVVAVNGQVIAADVYGSAGLFKKAWPKLLKAAAADALAQLPRGDLPPAPSLADAERFLAAASAGQSPDAAPRGSTAEFEAVDYPNPALPTHLFSDGAGVAAHPAPNAEEPAALLAELNRLPQQGPAAPAQAGGGQLGNLGWGQQGGQAGGQPLNRTFAGRAGEVRVRLARDGGTNLNPPAPRTSAPSAGIVVVEAAAPARPGVTVHRSYLKK